MSVRHSTTFVCLAILLFQPPLPTPVTVVDHNQQDEAQASAQDLLIRSYIAGMQFVSEERAFHLWRLMVAAAPIQRELGKLWAEEAFQFTFQLPPSHNRLALQKNALAALSGLDPVGAFELFSRLDLPVAERDGSFPEDVRAHGAQTVFPNYWRAKGRAAWDSLLLAARGLGDTGQYPYVAMAPILRDLAQTDPAAGELLLGEAVSYYPRAVRFRNNNFEFAQFLKASWKTLPRSQTGQALEILTRQLERDAEGTATQSDRTYRAQAYTAQGVVRLRSEAAQLLLELLPLVQEIRPDMAKRLQEKISELKPGAQTDGPRIESVQIEGRATSAQVAALERVGFERSRLREIERISQTDPSKAIELSLTLTDPALRAIAFFRVATTLNRRAPGDEKELLTTARNLTTQIGDHAAKVRALTAWAEASAQMNDRKSFREALKAAFDLGEELFQQDLDANPGKPAIFATAFDELARLTYLGVRYDRETVLSRAMSLENAQLRAHLLIDAAQALHELRKAGEDSAKQ